MKIKDKTRIKINGKKLKIAIILPYFNETLGLELLENTKKTLLKNDVLENNITLIRVAGTLEIPFACKKISARKSECHGIIALGIVIRGETAHFDLVTQTTYHGLMQLQLSSGIPIAFGILACENLKQAQKRVSKTGLNKGKEAAEAILLQTQI